MASKIEESKTTSKTTTKTTDLIPCPQCGVEFQSRGLASHKKACQKKQQQKGKTNMKKDEQSKVKPSSNNDNKPAWVLPAAFILGTFAVLALLLFSIGSLLSSDTNEEQAAETPVVEDVPAEPEVNFVHSDEFTPEEFKKVSGYSIRSEVEKIVEFYVFYTNDGAPVAVPLIEVDGKVGPYLSDVSPKSEIRPKGEFWVGSRYQHVKIVDDKGLPLPGFPLVKNTKTGNYKTHIIALVPKS